MSTLTHWGERSGLRYCNHAKTAAPCSPAEFLQMSDLCRKCERGARIRLGCAKQNPIRTDSDRYTELRALVEAWQTARSASERDRASIPQAVSSVTANPTGQPEGWLARYMDTCAAETSLADWSHR